MADLKHVVRAAVILAAFTPVEVEMAVALSGELRGKVAGGGSEPTPTMPPTRTAPAAKAGLPPGRKRRKRRTREQMEADKAREAAEKQARAAEREQKRLAKLAAQGEVKNLAPVPAPDATAAPVPEAPPPVEASHKQTKAEKAAEKAATAAAKGAFTDPYAGEKVKTSTGEERSV